ncbi:MAG TPA: 1-acyl-sn-glycerol-3-phosphate acyltransferase [Polyangiaceae bacterium]|nr:1-acyl-sn-glycerol-3-phosphate acyltransferase [Polyangiaceae bacterium]
MNDLARELAALSASEMVRALGFVGGPALWRNGLELPFMLASRRLGETLAELDDAVAMLGLPAAAAQSLARLGVALAHAGVPIASGPCLVLANHPGAYDALSLMTALGRSDLLILAAERGFLRALPGLARHFLFVGESAAARAGALKRALSCLRRGGSLLHFPAGEIEPDANFEADATRWLKPWQPGVAALVKACARANGRVLVAGVRGVHSPSAKRFVLSRLAERRGVTTLAPLVQIVGKLRDVRARVHLAEVASAEQLSELGAEAQRARLRTALSAAISAA